MALPFAAGSRVFASDLNTATQQGAWTSYAVTWTSSGTAPAKGSGGTLVGYYSKIGRQVTVKIEFNSGTGTTFGTGYYTWSLPFAAATTGVPTNQVAHTGTLVASQGGSTAFYVCAAFISQGTPSNVNGLVNTSGTFFGATNPVTWTGNGVQFCITMTYESTS